MVLVFLHIPKTAGTALATILHHHYGNGFQGGVGHDSRTPKKHLAPNVFSRFEIAKRRLRHLGRSAKVRAISGHITFGLCDRLPQDAVYLTMLREPVDRTLSHYYNLVRPPKASQAGVGMTAPWLPPAAPELTLAAAFEQGYLLDNLQTRMLCGLVSPYDDLPPDALEQAKRNLSERFAYVGTTERFADFLALLNLELKWQTVAYRRTRANDARPRGEAVPADTRALAEERNALDRELYEHAAGLLHRALARAGPDVELEAKVLRSAAAARRRAGADLRSFSLDVRVELALKEAELAEAGVRVRRLKSKLRARSPGAARDPG